jgi:hypothetical protein
VVGKIQITAALLPMTQLILIEATNQKVIVQI